MKFNNDLEIGCWKDLTWGGDFFGWEKINSESNKSDKEEWSILNSSTKSLLASTLKIKKNI